MQRLENAKKEIGISNTDDKPLKQNIDVNWWHSGLWHGCLFLVKISALC